VSKPQESVWTQETGCDLGTQVCMIGSAGHTAEGSGGHICMGMAAQPLGREPWPTVWNRNKVGCREAGHTESVLHLPEQITLVWLLSTGPETQRH
jgi:hypothetical protein